MQINYSRLLSYSDNTQILCPHIRVRIGYPDTRPKMSGPSSEISTQIQNSSKIHPKYLRQTREVGYLGKIFGPGKALLHMRQLDYELVSLTHSYKNCILVRILFTAFPQTVSSF